MARVLSKVGQDFGKIFLIHRQKMSKIFLKYGQDLGKIFLIHRQDWT